MKYEDFIQHAERAQIFAMIAECAREAKRPYAGMSPALLGAAPRPGEGAFLALDELEKVAIAKKQEALDFVKMETEKAPAPLPEPETPLTCHSCRAQHRREDCTHIAGRRRRKDEPGPYDCPSCGDEEMVWM